jgi:peptidoglycan/xylan/chitin deacetylase (PgdA/CDA1 family)
MRYRSSRVRILLFVVGLLGLTTSPALAAKHHKKKAAAAPGAPAAPGTPAKPHHRSWPLPALGGSASGQPEVLFTFDDGPGGEITESVLATLRRHDVKAIFFQVGERFGGASSRKRIDALEQAILADGHAIGNHTVHHRDLCKKSSEGKIAAEIDENTRLLEEETHMRMVFFRTPYGVRCPVLEEALNERGLRHVHWDIDAEEWKTHDAVKTQNYIIHHIGELGDGQRAVVLIHDIHKETAAALPVILDWIDAENARRRAGGRHEIKILGPTDVAFERLAPGVAIALGQARAEVLGFLPGLERALALPLGGALAKL